MFGNSSKTTLTRTVSIIIIGGLIIFFHQISLLRPIENVIFKVLKPITSVLYRASLYVHQSAPCTSSSQENETNALLLENAKLKVQVQELQKLHDLADYSDRTKKNIVLSRVLSFRVHDSMKVLVIDRGLKHGIKKGNAVVASDGVLVGKIINSLDEISYALLIVDNNCSITVRIQNETFSPGVVVGEKGLSLKLQLVPQNEKIESGQVVVTAGLENEIPEGLVIGKIDKLLGKSSDLFQEAFIESFARFDQMDVVGVIQQ